MAAPINTIEKTTLSASVTVEVDASGDLKTAIGDAFDSYIVPTGKKVVLNIILDGTEVDA
jgi:hypothetical protein